MKLMSTLGLFSVLQAMLPEWEAAHGVKVEAAFDPTALMLERIKRGESADAAFLTSAGIDRLIADGLIVPGSRVDLARSLVGIAVKAGAPIPDLATIESTRRALLGMRVAYSGKGQSGIFFAGVLQRLGIAGEVNARAVILENGVTAEALLDGRADVAVQQMSELMLAPGIDIAGPLPAEIQDDLIFAGGVLTAASEPGLARHLIATMAESGRALMYVEKGLEPVNRG